MIELKAKNESEGVDPQGHSRRDGSNLGAYFNIVCAVAGAGTLGMPHAFAQGGWIAILLIIISGLLSWFAGKLLLECAYAHLPLRHDSYPAIGEAAFGAKGRIFIQIFHYAILLGVSSLFVMLSGINLHLVSKGTSFELTTRQWTWISGFLILIPYLCIKDMKEYVWLSILGVMTTVFTVVIACVLGLIHLPELTSIQHEPVNWTLMPVALSTIGFSFGGSVIYPHVESGMRDPKQWPRVLFLALLTVSGLYLLMGSVGYYVYGKGVRSPIMESLPDILANKIASIIITLHLILAAPLTLIAFSVELERIVGWGMTFRLASRQVIMVLLTVNAAYMPSFGNFMALLGAISNLVVIFVAPVACHLKLFGWRNRSTFTYLAMVGCILIGIVGGIIGGIEAFIRLITSGKHGLFE
ncbi:hypothetical protein DSO57_1019357 [Entomophthora muscae]|uniref:Uncharacterized protein n=1 Tax=Entomophthora muscae TaxID=34485 RepID=A0ACC2T435_9FUNG|nr:hypothetical protein DSO57_1019357 [Entomophthora muscae]